MNPKTATIVLIVAMILCIPFIIKGGEYFANSYNDTDSITLERYRQSSGTEVFRAEERRRLCEDFCISEGYTNNTR